MKKNVYLLLPLFLITGAFISKKKVPKRKTDELVTISTRYGKIQVILFEDCPLHKANFLKLARSGYYDGTTFHRVIKDFMIQGGDPNSKDTILENDGSGGPGYTIEHEISNKHTHIRGAVCAARQGGAQNPDMRSSGSQFYIVENLDGFHDLDGKYTVFGQVVKGMTYVELIAMLAKDGGDRPYKDMRMTVTIEELTKEKITELTGYNYDKK
jgi:cyclophilin family peptidyl-prolyl cis-trans isomerase